MAYFSPLGNGFAFVDSNGNPLSGAKLFTYIAGSSTKQTVYKNEASSSSHTNPIVLDANGRSPDPIWLTASVSHKFVLAPSNDTDPPASPIETWDDIDGVNDTSVSVDQWVSGPTPTYVSATQFTLVGDQSSTFHVGRRVKTTNSGGTIYSRISAVAYTTLTTVTVVNDSGTLDAGLSAVSYGLVSATNPSIDVLAVSRGVSTDTAQTISGAKIFTGTLTMSGAAINHAALVDVASAATTNIGAAASNYVRITGTTTITAFDTVAAGIIRRVKFADALTLTHNGASLVLPGSANITTAVDDTAEFQSLGSGQWVCSYYKRQSGLPIVAVEVGTWTPTIAFNTSGNVSVAYTTQLGRYTRKGREITVTCDLLTSSFTHTTASGNLEVRGLPFASANDVSQRYEGALIWGGITKANYTQVTASLVANTTIVTFVASGSAQATSNVTHSDVPSGGTVDLAFTLTYRTA